MVLLCLVGACAAKPVAPPVVSTPRFPDFVEPTVPEALADSAAALGQQRAWRFLQAGDFVNAEVQLAAVLRIAPGFYPADAAFGYLELARQDAGASLARFDRALDASPAYAPALVGRGEALLALGRESDALRAFEAAAAADPSLADVRRRVEVLQFRRLELDIAAAREAAEAGNLDRAARAYAAAIAESPDSAFLYRELADLERRRGEEAAALEHFRKAIALDPADAVSLVRIGDLLLANGDLDEAARAYREALLLEPSADVEARLERVEARVALAGLPEPYRAIAGAPRITRADLAALIAVRLAPLVQERDPVAVVITDVRGHWAASWIMAVARARIMEPFANHTFQPAAPVRRADLAQVLSRLLPLTGAGPAALQAWQSARPTFADLSASHLAYPAASVAVASGLMSVRPGGAFQPSNTVTGAEAGAAIGRLEDLVAGSAAGPAGPR